MMSEDDAMKHFEELQKQIRLLEMRRNPKPNVLYEVYETNAELQHGKLRHQGYDRDLAESKFLLLANQERAKDFLLYDHTNNIGMAALFSKQTQAAIKESK